MPAETEPQRTTVDVPREGPRAILFQFVVFPLAVVAVGVLIFLLFGYLATDRHSIPEYLSEIEGGSTHARWQAAYQLSKSLKRGEAKDHPDLALKVAAIYQRADDDDPRVRRYLAMVLGNLGDRRATPVLLEGLGSADQESRLYALWALAELKDRRSVPRIVPLLRSDDRDVRKTAAYALGEVADPESGPLLRPLLADPEPDVRWNAAIALAKMNDSASIGVLREMLDRNRLATIRMREDQKEAAMLAAIAAVAAISPEDAQQVLQPVAASDPNLRVRDAAARTLASIR
jgi:HEAT repeat protein